MDKTIEINLVSLDNYIQRFSEIFLNRLDVTFNSDKLEKSYANKIIRPLDDKSIFTKFIIDNSLSEDEILLLLLAIIPHLKPSLLDDLIKQTIPNPGDYPQLGGVRGNHFRGFLPTGETAVFALSGDEISKRSRCQQLFNNNHILTSKNVLWLDEVGKGEPLLSGKLIISQEYLELFTSGNIMHPKLSMEFPAQYITTEMEWDDLVLNETTMKQIEELEIWVKHHYTLMHDWGMQRKLKPGYRALFYGPAGTGKTLTATLLGKYTGKDVFKIDLSMVVSKFIGETEKNLSQLFNKAENKNWILFFDEADALFSKRTNVRDAHDKYANQEAAYLLQRIETFDGLVILASNFKNNIDDAFIRRFHSIIHFPIPNAAERLALWQKAFPSNVKLSDKIDLHAVSKKYELVGSAIMSTVQFCCLHALARETAVIDEELLMSGIKKEYLKEGKIW